ncbi:bifunctional hydroxymethylpyrimidine kinase/phosphomethylpyrimidine kinase [Bordetella parapertussis]|uniref:hydroxymethylpyrimidine kinase n=2 Tax=Bordetella parapertussis TaxID=519 RepID=Q7W3P4_BORPA|nr:bifunctional hydroxymethylpyrimidine kinase/phosphomethylpyrimidine kinase [Bordetella parapertussis]AOB40890.1 bifunctional hydroxymethylpyrimidine kinase/phosphomethylpyrimidine kinase [Bordetella parapertussis]AUL44928.1 bifunctional hydroxymethylpyrimidine kinase/phosphomethylpyrimidine kinase [Bordetella parapertussis]AWP64830.1 bifunctional hydroxymethylpyrimidine kinase/phosphomethylpyrimidine kinase [Bordetella parapertussis]AWP72337.1 bifunctional hydroxymethylpyrimidine kinase/phos
MNHPASSATPRGERRIPNALSIAGVDPSGGAGVLADVKAMSALGAYGCAVIAAMTAQNTQGVTGISPVPAEFVGLQIDTLFADVPIDAVKLGMLGQEAVTLVVAEKLARWQPAHIVLDPVMVAKSGDLLLERGAVGALRETLLPLATLLTPNLPEAGVLLDERPVETLKEMRRVAERLRNRMTHAGQRWVMVKGGHLPGNETIDLLHDGDRMIELPGHRIETPNTHGTGCTLSAALAALLPQSPDVPEAARRAKAYLTEAIRQADRLQVGSGHGPVHHFHAWW